jgi:hypothetical protein
MGKASQRKKDKRPTIRLAGEQAEAFDAQMDKDRAMFEQTDACVCFRPQIPGEWNEHQMLGHKPPIIGPIRNGQIDFLPSECTWTAVVDIGRVDRVAKGEAPGAPTGLRTRIACPPVLTPEDEIACSQAAQVYALAQMEALRRMGRDS